MTTTQTTPITIPDMNNTEYCTRCGGYFKPEDGWTNAYGSFHCKECSHIDKKKQR